MVVTSNADTSREAIQEGVGSGFVWDKFGHIVTNYHCIAKLARDQTGKQVHVFPDLDKMDEATYDEHITPAVEALLNSGSPSN